MKTSSLILLAFVLSIVAGILLQISAVGKHHFAQINSYADCVAAGNPILESYPSQCKTLDGRTFVNPNEHVDMPQQSPQPQQTQQSQQYVESGCVVGGCSGEICTEVSTSSEGGVVSSCLYLAEFACYKMARCERQTDGKCGWSQNAALQSCINAAPETQGEPMSN